MKVFDPQNMRKLGSNPDYEDYGTAQIQVLCEHYGCDKVVTVDFNFQPLDEPVVHKAWIDGTKIDDEWAEAKVTAQAT